MGERWGWVWRRGEITLRNGIFVRLMHDYVLLAQRDHTLHYLAFTLYRRALDLYMFNISILKLDLSFGGDFFPFFFFMLSPSPPEIYFTDAQ